MFFPATSKDFLVVLLVFTTGLMLGSIASTFMSDRQVMMYEAV